MSEATGRQWSPALHGRRDLDGWDILLPDGQKVARAYGAANDAYATAFFIARDHNSHDKLVEALEKARRDLRDYGAAPIQQVREEMKQALKRPSHDFRQPDLRALDRYRPAGRRRDRAELPMTQEARAALEKVLTKFLRIEASQAEVMEAADAYVKVARLALLDEILRENYSQDQLEDMRLNIEEGVE